MYDEGYSELEGGVGTESCKNESLNYLCAQQEARLFNIFISHISFEPLFRRKVKTVMFRL